MFPAEPLEVVASASGRLTIAVRTSPQPPIRGINAAQLAVRDVAGGAKDGLTLTVVPWMPAHGHGSSVLPTVTPQGGGIYVLTDLVLEIPGLWELQTTIVDSESDSADPSFEIP